MTVDTKLTSPKEEALFPLTVIAAGLLWCLLVVGTCGFGLFYVAIIGAAILIAHSLFLAQVKGNGLKLSERQLPELYARCKAAAERLHMAELPEIYLLQSGGALNAFATKLLSRKFVIIYSSLVDDCADPRQLDFVIGHELGHLAAGHLKWNAFLLPAKALPWLGAAYSRACEYTCDRYGFQVVGDLEPSMRALAVLAAGGRLSGQVDLQAFLAQREETGGFWMAVGELVSSHPYLCKRVAALQELSRPGSLRPIARNPLSYPFAPFLGAGLGGAGLGGMMAFVAIAGILAAIAIPNFIKYQERAKATATGAHQTTQQADLTKMLQHLEDGQGKRDELLQEGAKPTTEETDSDDAEEDGTQPEPASAHSP